MPTVEKNFENPILLVLEFKSHETTHFVLTWLNNALVWWISRKTFKLRFLHIFDQSRACVHGLNSRDYQIFPHQNLMSCSYLLVSAKYKLHIRKDGRLIKVMKADFRMCARNSRLECWVKVDESISVSLNYLILLSR